MELPMPATVASPSLAASATVRSSRSGTILARVLSVLLTLVFLAAAGAKLAGVPMMVANFDKIGFGQWFRYVTAILEIVGAVALWVPRMRFFGAVLLAIIMIGAVTAHLTALGTNPMPPIVLFVLSATVAWLRRPSAAE